jgi:hypothetical protein
VPEGFIKVKGIERFVLYTEAAFCLPEPEMSAG